MTHPSLFPDRDSYVAARIVAQMSAIPRCSSDDTTPERQLKLHRADSTYAHFRAIATREWDMWHNQQEQSQ